MGLFTHTYRKIGALVEETSHRMNMRYVCLDIYCSLLFIRTSKWFRPPADCSYTFLFWSSLKYSHTVWHVFGRFLPCQIRYQLGLRIKSYTETRRLKRAFYKARQASLLHNATKVRHGFKRRISALCINCNNSFKEGNKFDIELHILIWMRQVKYTTSV